MVFSETSLKMGGYTSEQEVEKVRNCGIITWLSDAEWVRLLHKTCEAHGASFV